MMMAGLRITGGSLRGRVIAPPKSAGVRPTTGRVRESLFARLSPYLPGARVLDGFAGSGILGFEALSRGATQVVAVEAHRPTAQALITASQQLGLGRAQYEVKAQKLETFLTRETVEPFDLVLLDAPYGYPRLATIIQQLQSNHWVHGLLLVEHAPEQTSSLPAPADRWLYGGTIVSVYREEAPC